MNFPFVIIAFFTGLAGLTSFSSIKSKHSINGNNRTTLQTFKLNKISIIATVLIQLIFSYLVPSTSLQVLEIESENLQPFSYFSKISAIDGILDTPLAFKHL